MKKRVLCILLAAMMVLLAGCSADTPESTGDTAAQTETQPAETKETASATDPAGSTAATEPVTTEPMETPSAIAPTKEGEAGLLQMEHLELCLNWLDRTVEDAGIPDEYILRDGEVWEINIEGKLYGVDATGTVELMDDMGETVVDGVCLTCGTLSYEDCHAKLEEVYGAPVEEKVDKSGQTAQGDVTYAVFQNGEHEVWLSKGTEEDFIRLEVY